MAVRVIGKGQWGKGKGSGARAVGQGQRGKGTGARVVVQGQWCKGS